MVKRRLSTSKSSQTPSGNVRIISGLWRGRKLPVFDAEGLRPTTDRVKETLFNWIAQDIPSARCLDLFSGSGSLGFEAASRQASLVTMIELNPNAYAQLEKNRTTLKADNIELLNKNALDVIAQSGTPYDIIFIDPPFRRELLEQTLHTLDENTWVASGSIIYVESEKEWIPDSIPNSWELFREKTAGQVTYRLFIKNA